MSGDKAWRFGLARSIMGGGRPPFATTPHAAWRVQGIDGHMDARVRFECEIPPEVAEAIALRAAQLVESRVDEVGPWLTASEAADYLRCPVSRINAFTSARRIPVHRDGSRLLFGRNELDLWIEQGGGKRPG